MSQWENQMFISVYFHSLLEGKWFGRHGFPRIAITPIFQNSLLHQVCFSWFVVLFIYHIVLFYLVDDHKRTDLEERAY